MLTRLAPLGPVAGALGRGCRCCPARDRIARRSPPSRRRSATTSSRASSRGVPDRPFTGLDARSTSAAARVELIEVGPAHTPGDAIAWVPDARVVFAGDILFNGVTPIMWAGPVDNWIAALERIEELEPGGRRRRPRSARRARRGARAARLLALARERGRRGAERRDAGALAERLVRSREWRDAPWARVALPERTLVNVARIAATAAAARRSRSSTLERIRLIGGDGRAGESGCGARRRPVAGRLRARAATARRARRGADRDRAAHRELDRRRRRRAARCGASRTLQHDLHLEHARSWRRCSGGGRRRRGSRCRCRASCRGTARAGTRRGRGRSRGRAGPGRRSGARWTPGP